MSLAAIFVPHQDDEINLVGNILSKLASEYEVYIIYSSLDTDVEKGRIRKKEAISACGIFSINEDHIIFLEYPDTANKQGHHYFTDGDKSIIQEIEKILYQFRPELIIGTDFDFHADHRMLSLALDEAVRNVILDDIAYRPRYLKGFCYETAYYGIDDYSATALQNTTIECELLGNVSYRWEDRVSLKSNEKNGLIVFKKAYKALKCHKSQYALLHARSIINADNVFWEKRTDNLLLNKETVITATSGDVSKLNDFKVIDTDDIITVDQTMIDYDKGVWKGDNKQETIYIKWSKWFQFNEIIFHGHPANKTDRKIQIVILSKYGDKIAMIDEILAWGRPTIVKFDTIKSNEITIKVESVDAPVELSEIEILFTETKLKKKKSFKNTEIGINCSVNRNLMDIIDICIFKFQVFLLKIMRRIKICYSTSKNSIKENVSK